MQTSKQPDATTGEIWEGYRHRIAKMILTLPPKTSALDILASIHDAMAEKLRGADDEKSRILTDLTLLLDRLTDADSRAKAFTDKRIDEFFDHVSDLLDGLNLPLDRTNDLLMPDGSVRACWSPAGAGSGEENMILGKIIDPTPAAKGGESNE